MLNKSAGINLAGGFVSLCVINLCYGQGAGPAVEVPTTRGTALIDLSSNRDGNDNSGLTVASEFKSTAKNVVEPEKPVFWEGAVDIGYTSEYNFRGTNLTPNADGGAYIRADISKWGFTLGVFDIRQIGEAHANTWSMGEGGGGGSGTFNHFFFASPGVFADITTTLTPETKQTYFNELDVFLQYQKSFGWVDLTVGNIGFFIDRQAHTDLTFGPITGDIFVPVPPFVIPINQPGFKIHNLPTVEDEQFDRLYVALSTSKIPHIQPQITYYQTLYNNGQDPFNHVTVFVTVPRLGINHQPATYHYHGGERNTELGGYLEGKIKGIFPITDWISFNPIGVISASFHDRSEPNPDFDEPRGIVRGKSLCDWNVAQLGAEIPIHLLHRTGTSEGSWAPPDLNVYFVPFAWYSYHISDPTPQTDRNEWWGGAEFTVTF